MRRNTLLLLAALLPLLAACAPREARGPFTESALAELDLPALAAQVTAPALTVPPGDPAAAEAAFARLLASAERGVGGVLVTGAAAADLAARLEAVQAAAPLPLLVAARLDGGVGGVLDGATELPALPGLAALGDDPAERLGRMAGREARAHGIHLGLVTAPPFPVPDDAPAPATRAAAERSFLGYARGLADGGVLVGARVFDPASREPVPPTLRWDRAAVEVLQLAALREVLAEAVTVLEAAPVVLPSLTGDTLPLPVSPVFTAGTVRRDLGFAGLMVADLSPDGPLARRYGAAEAAVQALAAGADLLVGMDDAEAVAAALVSAVEAGRVPRGRLEAAVRRVFDAKAAAGIGRGRGGGVRDDGAAARSREAHQSAARRLGAPPGEALAGCRAPALAALPGAPLDTLAAAMGGAHPGLTRLAVEAVPAAGPLGADGAAPDPDCVLIVRFHGRGPVVTPPAADATSPPPPQRRIAYVDFLPATGWTASGARSVLLVYGTGPDAQHAAARILRGDAPVEPAPDAAAWPPALRLRAAAPGAAGVDAARLVAIDRAVNGAIAQGMFTAGAVAVGHRGALVKLTGYGAVGGAPVDPAATVFDLASLTKVVGTTAALMVLVDDGRVELDAPAHRYLPELRGDGRDEITVRHLLAHTAGLPPGEWLFGQAGSPGEALERVYAAPVLTPPGSQARYSDFGMMLLAEIVRRQAEEPMDYFLVRRVYGPLGMASTFFLPPEGMWSGVVPTAAPAERPYALQGVVHDGNAFRLGGVTGHAGLFSTAADLAVFAQAMLNGGAYGSERVWPGRLVQGFAARQRGADNRALGWETPSAQSSAGRYFTARSFGHTGFTGTSLWIDPERELFVVFLANRTFADGTIPQMARLRRVVHEAAAQAVADPPARVRPGAR